MQHPAISPLSFGRSDMKSRERKWTRYTGDHVAENDYFSLLPDAVLKRIGHHLIPLDRLRMQLSCRRLHAAFFTWSDVIGVEISSGDHTDGDNREPRVASTIVHIPTFIARKRRRRGADCGTYKVRITTEAGDEQLLRSLPSVASSTRVLKTLLARFDRAQELTVWNSCIGAELCRWVKGMNSFTTLRLWDCRAYFENGHLPKIAEALLSLPNLKSLLVLDSTPRASLVPTSHLRQSTFTRHHATCIRAPVENLQLTAVYLPLSAMRIISEKLANVCTRLALGCTYGKSEKRLHYLNAIGDMRRVKDLDLPPFIFNLDEIPAIDAVVERLLQRLPLSALGFRHYNSSVLFRYIESGELPAKIQLLRVYHSSNRIPNFEELGRGGSIGTANMPMSRSRKKTSIISRCSILSGASLSSVESNYENQRRTCSFAKSDNLSGHSSDSPSTLLTDASATTAGESFSATNCIDIGARLSQRGLTIFAVSEGKLKCSRSGTQRLRKRTYCGVTVIYIRSSASTQEVVGRMATKTQSPHVYSKTLPSKGSCASGAHVGRHESSRLRVIKGDLVRPIPLSSLGMESDYELSDWEDND